MSFLTLLKAKLSSWFSRAEDPDETLDYSYEQQLRLIHEVKRGIAAVVTARKRLELQARGLEATEAKLEAQAAAALAGGREDLARQELERKVAVQHQLLGLKEQIAELTATQEKLSGDESRLATRTEAFRSHKEMLKAQYSAAEAQAMIGEAAVGLGDAMDGTGLALERARERVDVMEARAAALEELTSRGVLEPFDADQLGSQDEVEAELERLKSGQGQTTQSA
jgi:phage shock protein A